MAIDPKEEIDLPLGPVTEKLLQLSLPKSIGHVHTMQFARFLSTQLRGETIFPSMFLMEVELAFNNLRSGIDRDGKRITYREHHIDADHVSAAQPFIRMDLPAVIDVVFPADFAQQAKEILEEAQAAA